MVELAHVADAAQLGTELRTIEAALANFAAGGRIVSMEIAPPAPPPPEDGTPQPPPLNLGVPVSTVDIEYPPQMVAAITAALEQRRDAIEQELANIGVTGFQARKGK